MPGWKLLAALPLLVVPLVLLGLSFADGPEHRDSRPAVVLPAAVEGPRVTMRPAKSAPSDKRTGRPGGEGAATERPGPQPPGPQPPPAPPPSPDPAPVPDCTTYDDDDGVELVHPCPGVVGDDDDDDDDRDEGDDRDDDGGDD